MSEELDANATLMYWIGRFALPLGLLVALFALVSAERVSVQVSGNQAVWWTRFEIALPWFMMAGTGANIWVNVRRKKIDRQLAGSLLASLGMVAALLYLLLEKFAQLH